MNCKEERDRKKRKKDYKNKVHYLYFFVWVEFCARVSNTTDLNTADTHLKMKKTRVTKSPNKYDSRHNFFYNTTMLCIFI